MVVVEHPPCSSIDDEQRFSGVAFIQIVVTSGIIGREGERRDIVIGCWLLPVVQLAP